MELRKTAWDRYGATALRHVPPHATYSTMEEVADGLRCYGDLEASYLAAAIIQEIKARTGRVHPICRCRLEFGHRLFHVRVRIPLT